MVVAPNLTYTITQYNAGSGKTATIPIGGSTRASFNTGYNLINVKFSSDISLSKYEVRVTLDGEDYGVGIGKLVYYQYGNISANVEHTHEINVTAENFSRGDGTYRISLMAQNAVDLTWDVTTFLLTSEGLNVADSNGDLLEVYVQGNDYSIVEQTTGDTISVTNFTKVTQNQSNLNIG